MSLPARAATAAQGSGTVASPPASPDPRLDLRALLDAAEAAPPSAGIDALAAELAARVGATHVSFLITDINGESLTRLASTSAGGRHGTLRDALERVPLAGTAAGRTLLTQTVQTVTAEQGVWIYAPVSERGETLGVLELHLNASPDDPTLAYVVSAGHALAYVVIADRRHSDMYDLAARSTKLSLEAEIQRRLLPASFTCQGPQFALAGWLIPADSAGGDTFDYVVGEDTLAVSITDAMGHGVAAAQLATLAVGSLRNSRRDNLRLTEQAQQASRAVSTHAGADQFVTALLIRLDLTTGAADIVNAGHMNPLLVRAGTVTELELEADVVLGVLPDRPYLEQHYQFQSGDRLALVTDGMFERNAAEAEIESLLGTLSNLHPRETVQVLTRAVLDVTGGAVRDDATVVIVDWLGPLGPSGAAVSR